MRKLQQLSIVSLLSLASLGVSAADSGSELATAINRDYDSRLGKLFIDFHQNPELSLVAKLMKAPGTPCPVQSTAANIFLFPAILNQ